MNIVIWGGTSGVGEALAKRYYVEGHEVNIIGRHEGKFKKNFLGQFQNINYYQCDIKDEKKVTSLIDEIEEKEKVDLCVICSGIGINEKIKDENLDKAKEVFEVNTLGVFNVVKAQFPFMKKRKSGQVVFMGSVAGVMGLARNSGYCASKAAVHSLGQSWASNWRDDGILATTVIAGFINTPHTKDNNHKMRFLVNVQDAAQIIAEGVKRKKELIVFPKIPYYVMKILAFLPRVFSQKIMKRIAIY